MNSHGKRHPPPRWLLLGCALAATGSAALLAGCKGNTTSAAVTERHVTKPPTIVAGRAAGDIQASNPLNGDIWKNAEWLEFSAPINNSRTTPPTRCAVLFDDQTLYIAAVSQTPATRAPEATDKISFYVDTTAKGYELLEFSAAGGKVECTWLRSNSPAEPLEDGSPDLGFPVHILPNVEVPGLWCREFAGEAGEQAVVIGVPLAALPAPVRFAPSKATPWKINAVRTILVPREDGRRQRLESDLSPIYMGAQAVSPYRMAELKFQ